MCRLQVQNNSISMEDLVKSGVKLENDFPLNTLAYVAFAMQISISSLGLGINSFLARVLCISKPTPYDYIQINLALSDAVSNVNFIALSFLIE